MSATKNSKDAEEAIRVQQVAKETAEEENKALKQALITLKSQHIQLSAEWRANQKDLREKLQLADAMSMKKMNTLMLGLKYQKEKATAASFKVNELKGALTEYEKVTAKPVVIDVQILDTIVTQDPLSLEVVSLPEINLSDDPISSLDTFVIEETDGKDYEKLSAKEAEELRQAQDWMTSQQASCSAEFVSDAQIA